MNLGPFPFAAPWRRRLGLLLVVVSAFVVASGDGSARASESKPGRIEMLPSPDGWLGAWLLAGPYHAPLSPLPDAPSLGSSLGPAFLTAAEALRRGTAARNLAEPPRWIIASSSDGPIDVKSALRANDLDIFAYAAAELHVEQRTHLLFLLGADDGARIYVDQKLVYERDESRPQRDDDDIIPLELSEGDHPIVLLLHQRDGAWAFHGRILDASTLEPPSSAYLALPGTTLDDARTLASAMSWVSVDRGLSADGYHPRLKVRFPEGAPRGVPLSVRVRLVRGVIAKSRPPFAPDVEALFDFQAGDVPLTAEGVSQMVATLPVLGSEDTPLDDADYTYEVAVVDRRILARFSPRRVIREAIARTAAALASTPSDASWLDPGSLDSVRHLYDRVVQFGSHSDADIEGQLDEAKELNQIANALAHETDPYATRTGPMRRAYRSSIDDSLAEFGLYVPPSYRPGTKRTWPLVVGLHGLNGRPMAMVRYLFGFDDPNKENEWEDRHLGPLPPLEAFVVTPHGHGNTMYRDQGEDDVLRVMDWALSRYPIDPDRVTITGMSMGGIGSAAVALRHPDRFAAAEPLCGYHSYFVRRDISGRPMRPWEKLLAEERSNVFWADNGKYLPLYIVHGTLDQPEANSGVLIQRYEDLGYSVEHEHPELGHNVWQTTYEGFKGIDWLLPHRRETHPREIRFRTVRLRDGSDAWVHVDELTAPDVWGGVTARIRGHASIDVSTQGVGALHLDRDPALIDPRASLAVTIDGTTLHFDAGTEVAMHKVEDAWAPGRATHDGLYKRGEITGPIRDAYHAPLLFVYGASDPASTRANLEVARAWALADSSIAVDYPIMSDLEFFTQGEPIANDKALFLVGNAKTNRVVAALEPDLPIRVEGDAIVVGGERIRGRELGAAFVRPNPRRPDRYVVVIEGTDAAGTWRSLSLPSLLPDFVIYDQDLASSRGQMLLGAGSVRAAGFFANDWSLPASLSDPLARTKRAQPKNEYEATPYLP
jgi:poly(3-hydroxybutyrate) depolymerase